ncbi:hypothetical protein FJ365_01940 [Candidatus Dependentiae bacterium]|nr:hypothetical protein [Candidatus Dependentiae bacterium]
MKRLIGLLYFMISIVYMPLPAAEVPLAVAAVTIADIKAVLSKVEKCRLGANIAIIIIEALRYAMLEANEVDSFAEDHYEVLVRSMALIKVPALMVGAIAESNLSLPGVFSDMIAATGVKGFWADVCSGHEPRRSTAICVAAIIISGFVVAKIFNALNPLLKKHYPKDSDEGRRRMLRSAILILGNLVVPVICWVGDQTNMFWFSQRSMQALGMISCWHGVMNNLIAEMAGYIIAQFIKNEGVIHD